jgi:hypothetical protein
METRIQISISLPEKFLHGWVIRWNKTTNKPLWNSSAPRVQCRPLLVHTHRKSCSAIGMREIVPKVHYFANNTQNAMVSCFDRDVLGLYSLDLTNSCPVLQFKSTCQKFYSGIGMGKIVLSESPLFCLCCRRLSFHSDRDVAPTETLLHERRRL